MYKRGAQMDSKAVKKLLLSKNPELKKLRQKKRFSYEVADSIIEARILCGFTQEQLALKVGTKQPAIARLENGDKLPSLQTLQEIADALNMEIIAPKFEHKIEYKTSIQPVAEYSTASFVVANRLCAYASSLVSVSTIVNKSQSFLKIRKEISC